MSVSIYVLIDPRDGHARYVGKTKLDIQKRLLGHLSDARRDRKNIARFIWIKRLVALSLLPEIDLLEIVDDCNWQEAEQFWIAFLRGSGCDLLNATAGGDGIHNHKHTEETRRKQSEAAKRRYQIPGERERSGAAVRAAYEDPEKRELLRLAWFRRDPAKRMRFSEIGVAISRTPEGRERLSRISKGRVVSAETRKKISEKAIGRRWSDEQRAKCSERRKGKKHSEETKAKISASNRATNAAKRAAALEKDV